MMTNAEAIRQLEKLRERLKELHAEVRRKRWKDSVKAMTMAGYQMEIDAINRALICLANHKG